MFMFVRVCVCVGGGEGVVVGGGGVVGWRGWSFLRNREEETVPPSAAAAESDFLEPFCSLHTDIGREVNPLYDPS